MKITVICVGKLKEKFWVQACAEYLKRLGAYARVDVREVADRDPTKSGGEEGAREKEAAAILAACPMDSHVVLLAIEGVQRTSEGLAERIDQLGMQGKSSITFIIGGSYGVSAAVHARANETLSLGAITLPHNLARVVLLEQIYRAFKISRGEPYHK